MTLYEALKQNEFVGLPQPVICSIAHQILVCLQYINVSTGNAICRQSVERRESNAGRFKLHQSGVVGVQGRYMHAVRRPLISCTVPYLHGGGQRRGQDGRHGGITAKGTSWGQGRVKTRTGYGAGQGKGVGARRDAFYRRASSNQG